MEPITLDFYTRADCDLCASAHEVVERVLDAVPEHIPVIYREIDVAQDTVALDKYGEFLPVVVVDGVQHSTFTVREDRLAQEIVRVYRERKLNAGKPKQAGRLTRLVRRLAKRA